MTVAIPWPAASQPHGADHRPLPAALADVRPGRWQLQIPGEALRDICVADARNLMQIRHGAAACDSLVVENGERVATVQYSCPAAGWGRTTLRRATSTHVHIDSQGIADNAPFAFAGDARRTGECPPAATPAR